GTGITASYVATNAEILPLLGRNLSSCAPTGACNATTTIALIPNDSRFDDRLNQIDMRVTRSVKVNNSRIQGIFEVYNGTNTRPSQSNTTTFNVTPSTNPWLRPSLLLGGRVAKFGVQVDF